MIGDPSRLSQRAALARWIADVALCVAVGAIAAVAVAAWRPSATTVAFPALVLVGSALLVCVALARFEAFVVVLLASRSAIDGVRGPVGLDPPSVVAALFLATALCWLFVQRGHAPHAPTTHLHLGYAAVLVAATTSVVASESVGTSMLELLRIASVVAMFFVLTRLVTDRRTTERVLAALYVSAAIPVTVAIGGLLLGAGVTEKKGEFTRLTSTFAQSNTFARYLMLVIVTAVALRPHVAQRVRIALTALLAAAAACLLLTYTVGAWIATSAALVCVGLLQHRRLAVGVIVVAILAILAAPGVSARLSDAGVTAPNATEEPNSFAWRLSYWSELLPLASSNPLTGVGLGVTGELTDAGKAPHNDFLSAYVETGLVGLAAYVALIASCAATARGALRRAGTGIERGIAVAFAGSCVAFVVSSTAANVLRSVALLWYFAALGALAVSIGRREVCGGAR